MIARVVRAARRRLSGAEGLVSAVIARLGEADRECFAGTDLQTVKDVREGPVLVLAPHADDEVLGLGGTLSLHLRQGSPVTVLYMTDGAGPAGDTHLAAARRQEAESLGRAFALRGVFWSRPDGRLTNDDDAVAALRRLIEAVEPAVVYVPSFFESHFDHFTANQILRDALAGSAHQAMAVAGYEVWDNLPFPNYVVDVSSEFARKLEMLEHYRTPLAVSDFAAFCRSRNALRYFLSVDSHRRRAATGFAEAFYRLDRAAYVRVYDQYRRALADAGSDVARRLR